MKKIDYLRFLPQKKRIDFPLFIMTVLFTVFGLVMIYEASNVAAFLSFSDKYHFVKDQFIWALIGFFTLGVLSQIHYRKYFYFAVPVITVAIISLIVVLIPGIGLKAMGARRWIDLGFFSFQPSEVVKISLILYLSSWFTNKEKGRFLPFLFLLAFIVGLVILQPDLGTAV